MLLPIRILLCLLIFLADSALAKKHVALPKLSTDAAYVLDSASNAVLYENGAEIAIAPASMAKLMTSAIIFDALANKKIQLNQTATITHEAWLKGGAPSGASTMFAKLNSQVSVADLLHGLIIDNANDAALVLSQLVAANETEFANLMNSKAKQIGLQSTIFVNATGLPKEGQAQTTNLKDLVLLLQYLINHYPDYVAIAQQPTFTWNNITQHNKNPLLNKLGPEVAVLGGGTGYAKDQGYAMVACAKKGTRIVYIAVANAASSAARLHHALELANMAFSDYREQSLYKAGETILTIPLYGGKNDVVEAVASEDIVVLLDKDNKHDTNIQLIYKAPVIAPVKAGQKLGAINIVRDGQIVQSKQLLAKADFDSAKFTRRAKHAAYELCFGWIKRLYLSIK